MKIKKMTATFGCLNGAAMTFHDGLNIVCMPNESGKSTWCAFIRAMLYGIDSKERAKGNYLPDKTRYAPWSGSLMAGAMEIDHTGKAITLRRASKTASHPLREFTAVYTGTEEPVSGLSGTDVGETLTGVSREVFRRSAFIGQGEMAVTADTQLEKRIAAVVSTGEEGTSYTEADKRLRAWQRKRRYKKSGAIPELDVEIEAQNALLDRLSRSTLEREWLLEELEQGKKDASALADRIAAVRDEQRNAALEWLRAAKERELESLSALETATEDAAIKQAALKTGPFGGMSPDEAAQAAGTDAEKAAGLLKIAENKASVFTYILMALLCLISLVLGFAVGWPYFIPAAIFAATTVVLGFKYSAVKKAVQDSAAKRADILRQYSVQSEEDIYALADAHALRYEEYRKARTSEENARAALGAARAEHDKAQSRLIDGGDSDKTTRLERERASIVDHAASVGEKLSQLTGSFNALGDPMAIQSGVLEMKEHRRQLETQEEALAIAGTVLKEADTEIQSRFSPALGRAAAGYMARLTGGRYDEITLSRDFTAMARVTGDTVPHETAYLSAGAVDLLYLAVRLAVCELALPTEDPCPIVLDDALTNLDPARTERAMTLLSEIGEKRQVILFTCK